MSTCHPSRPNARDMAAPMRLAPPVTRTAGRFPEPRVIGRPRQPRKCEYACTRWSISGVGGEGWLWRFARESAARGRDDFGELGVGEGLSKAWNIQGNALRKIGIAR